MLRILFGTIVTVMAAARWRTRAIERTSKAPAPPSLKLTCSARWKVYQWRFHGVHPADSFQLKIFVYVASSEIKDYESLLVVEGEELERLKRFGRALNVLRRRQPETKVDVQFSWSEGDRVRTVDLWEILALHETNKVTEFIRHLHGGPNGLGAINLAADPAALPKVQSPAQVVVTVRKPRGTDQK